MAMLRESFSRHKEYIAVKRIRISSTEFIEPGQDIDKNKFKLFQIMRWYNMRRIGVKDSLWSEEMLKQVNNAHARPEVTAKPVQVKREVTKKPRQSKVKNTEVINNGLAQWEIPSASDING
jgi:hypothetical protein